MISDSIARSSSLFRKSILPCVYIGKAPLMLVFDLVDGVLLILDASPQESFSSPQPHHHPAFPQFLLNGVTTVSHPRLIFQGFL